MAWTKSHKTLATLATCFSLSRVLERLYVSLSSSAEAWAAPLDIQRQTERIAFTPVWIAMTHVVYWVLRLTTTPLPPVLANRHTLKRSEQTPNRVWADKRKSGWPLCLNWLSKMGCLITGWAVLKCCKEQHFSLTLYISLSLQCPCNSYHVQL